MGPVQFVHPLLTRPHEELSLKELQELGEFEAGFVPFFVDEPNLHFQAAYEDFNKKDMHAAAAEIRSAVRFLNVEVGRAPAQEKILKASVRELERLASQVEKGTFTSTDDMVLAFARAEYALAKHHQMKAREAWMATVADARTAGQYLEATLAHVKHGEAWVGVTTEDPVIKDAETLVRELREGTGFSTNRVSKATGAVFQKIEKLSENALFLEQLEFEGEGLY